MKFPVSKTAHKQCHDNEMHAQQSLIFTLVCYAVAWPNGYHFKYIDILLIYSISAALTSLNSMILLTCYWSQYLTLTGYWLIQILTLLQLQSGQIKVHTKGLNVYKERNEQLNTKIMWYKFWNCIVIVFKWQNVFFKCFEQMKCYFYSVF